MCISDNPLKRLKRLYYSFACGVNDAFCLCDSLRCFGFLPPASACSAAPGSAPEFLGGFSISPSYVCRSSAFPRVRFTREFERLGRAGRAGRVGLGVPDSGTRSAGEMKKGASRASQKLGFYYESIACLPWALRSFGSTCRTFW